MFGIFDLTSLKRSNCLRLGFFTFEARVRFHRHNSWPSDLAQLGLRSHLAICWHTYFVTARISGYQLQVDHSLRSRWKIKTSFYTHLYIHWIQNSDLGWARDDVPNLYVCACLCESGNISASIMFKRAKNADSPNSKDPENLSRNKLICDRCHDLCPLRRQSGFVLISDILSGSHSPNYHVV